MKLVMVSVNYQGRIHTRFMMVPADQKVRVGMEALLREFGIQPHHTFCLA